MRTFGCTALLALFVGCLPEEVSVQGKACDEDHPCGGGWVCSTEGRCGHPSEEQADGGGTSVDENLLHNGGFEAQPDGLAGWRPADGAALGLSTDVFRTAAPSMVVSQVDPEAYAGAALDKAVLPSPASAGHSGAVYCVEAWVRRKEGSSTITLALRVFDSASNFLDNQGEVPAAKVVPVTDDWYPVRSFITAAPPHDAALILRIFSSAPSFYLDDVRVWVPPGGSCG